MTGLVGEAIKAHIDIVERRGSGMSGPTLARDRHGYVDDEAAFEAARRLAGRWL
jgi:hypothetical protein